MVRLVLAYPVAAMNALKPVETGKYIAQTYFSLKAPMTRQQPLIAVADSCTVIPALMSGIAAVSEQAERSRHIACIELASVEMQPEKVTVEFFAKPVTGLRLDEKVLPLPVFAEIPGIVVA